MSKATFIVHLVISAHNKSRCLDAILCNVHIGDPIDTANLLTSG